MLLSLDKRDVDIIITLIGERTKSMEQEIQKKELFEFIFKISIESLERDKKLLAYLKEKSDECED